MADSSRKAASRKRERLEPAPAGKREEAAAREQVTPIMLRPGAWQKECVEQIARQLGIKRSQLDPMFYLSGALLTAVEKLGKEEMIGTWTRKEVAIFLKNAFTPFFELLYEQDELPLVFTLLISRGAALPAARHVIANSVSVAQDAAQARTTPPVPEEQPAAEAYFPLLSADAEIGLDGFPGDI